MTCIVRRLYLPIWAFFSVWPLSAAASTFANGVQGYDWESLAYAVCTALVGAALATLPAGLLIYGAQADRYAAEKRAEASLLLSEARLTLDAALAGRLVILRSLAALAAARPEVDQKDFSIFASVKYW